jgi:hypothetical protein
VKVDRARASANTGSPWWSTVRRIVVETPTHLRSEARPGTAVVAMLAHPVMRSLRALHGLGKHGLAEIEGTGLRLEELSVACWDAVPALPRTLDLSGLRTLGIVAGAPGGAHLPDAWTEHEAWSGVRELVVSSHVHLGTWLPWLATHGRGLERVVFVGERSRAIHLGEAWHRVLSPTGDGRFRLEARALAGLKDWDGVVEHLAGPPPELLAAVRVESTTVLTKRAKALARVRELPTRLPGVEVEVP